MAVNTQAIFGVVKREGMEKGFWTRIGTAFQNHDGSWNLRFDYVLVEGPNEVGPAVAGQDPMGSLPLALDMPADALKCREDPGRPGGPPAAHAAAGVSKVTLTGPGGPSPCSSRSARTRSASAWT